MIKLATFAPMSKQLLLLEYNRTLHTKGAQTLVCSAFFRRSDEPDGSFNVTRVALELDGDLVDGDMHATDDTQFSWQICLGFKCSAAKKLYVHDNTTKLTLDALPPADEVLSAVKFKLDVLDAPEQHRFIVKRLVLKIDYDFEPTPTTVAATATGSTGSGNDTVAFYSASIADWSQLSIVAIVIASFCCGIVCAGVVWSICRRGKKPIAYDKA